MTSYPLSWPTYTGVKSDTLTLTRIQRAHKSPFSGATQVVANFSRWDLAVELPAMRLANAEKWAAWLDSLNGQEGTFRYAPSQSATSALSGITLDSAIAAGQTVIDLAGWSALAASTLRVGQMLTCGALFRILSAPANADAGGVCQVEVAPPVRLAYAGGTAVEFGASYAPRGLFRLAEPPPGYTQGADGWCTFPVLNAEEAL